MNAPSPAEQYRKQQEEADLQKLLEQTKDFTFINLMLKAIGIGVRK